MRQSEAPKVNPKQGVARYQQDRTQGPACAIAAGAATIYRNYFAPVNGTHGQTATRQLDALADLGEALSAALNKPVDGHSPNPNNNVRGPNSIVHPDASRQRSGRGYPPGSEGHKR